MSPFREDMKGVQEQDGEFVEIPAGIYPVIVERATEATTSTGLNMIKVKFRILEGEYKNSPLFTNVVFHEKMRGRNIHILRVLHQPCEEEPVVDASAWKDKEVRLQVRTRYNERFKRWNSDVTQWLYFTDEEEKEERERKKLRQLREKEASGMAGRVFGPDQPPSPPEAPKKTEGEEEDDIPF